MSKFDQILNTLLFSSEDVVPAAVYYSSNPTSCLPTTSLTAPGYLPTSYPAIGSQFLPPYNIYMAFPTPTFPDQPSCEAPTFPDLQPTSNYSPSLPVTCQPPSYKSEPTEPTPSAVIHHLPNPAVKASSFASSCSQPNLEVPNLNPAPFSFSLHEQDYFYRTKMMDPTISKHTLLDIITGYPSTPSPGKTPSSSSRRTSPAPKPYTNNRTSFTASQLRCLEARYAVSPQMSKPERELLSATIGVGEVAIRTWFQNRRARQKRKEAVKRDVEEAAKTRTANITEIVLGMSKK